MSYLTHRQREVLSFIVERLRTDGVAPTLREISETFGFTSTATAQKHVALLEGKGYLRREKHQKRGLVVLREGDDDGAPGTVPLLGTVAAGSPIDVVEEDERIEIPESMRGAGGRFVLRVRGDSMVDEGVFDGDLVVVRSAEQAREGEMVVALVDGEATLKRFHRETPDTVRLQPANPALPPLIAPSASVRIQGAVVGLLRRY